MRPGDAAALVGSLHSATLIIDDSLAFVKNAEHREKLTTALKFVSSVGLDFATMAYVKSDPPEAP